MNPDRQTWHRRPAKKEHGAQAGRQNHQKDTEPRETSRSKTKRETRWGQEKEPTRRTQLPRPGYKGDKETRQDKEPNSAMGGAHASTSSWCTRASEPLGFGVQMDQVPSEVSADEGAVKTFDGLEHEASKLQQKMLELHKMGSEVTWKAMKDIHVTQLAGGHWNKFFTQKAFELNFVKETIIKEMKGP